MEFMQESRLDITRNTLLSLESVILQRYLGWDHMKVITTLHFVEVLVSQGVLFLSDDTSKFVAPMILKKGGNSLSESIRKCSLFFADLS